MFLNLNRGIAVIFIELLLHFVVVGSISSGGDQGMHCR